MADRPNYARFLLVFASYTQPGEWITASRLAHRIIPHASSQLSKEISRKLSNLNRFGHLERRLNPQLRMHEYARPSDCPIVLPPELAGRFRFGVLTMPDYSLVDFPPDGGSSGR